MIFHIRDITHRGAMDIKKLNKARRLAYRYLNNEIQKYENCESQRTFEVDYKLAMNYLLEDGGTWHSPLLESLSASQLETILHIETWQEIKSKTDTLSIKNEAEQHLSFLNNEFDVRFNELISEIKSTDKSIIRTKGHEQSDIGKARAEITEKYNAKKSILANEARWKKFIMDMYLKYHKVMKESTIQKLVVKLNKGNEFISKKLK